MDQDQGQIGQDVLLTEDDQTPSPVIAETTVATQGCFLNDSLPNGC